MSPLGPDWNTTRTPQFAWNVVSRSLYQYSRPLALYTTTWLPKVVPRQ